ncbi:metallophosphoesterase family protein [Haloimpatiens lingqiaonensis]|uniref:metallophosphoesterase family protein n=1 Tax=Haloimpatiens lingqiaonensis TaxID=1380675 RepID=UPI0010FF348C|nr:metallophosphoesterase [Haloimpatiens lingqiaonensis]
MKRKLRIIFVIIVAISSIFIVSSSMKNIRAKTKLDELKGAKLVFPVISDVHIGGFFFSERKFKNALIDLKELYPNYNAIAIVGDCVNSGTKAEYMSFMNILNKYKEDNAKVMLSMGNHEYYCKGPSNREHENIFVHETGMAAIYYDKWVQGYHFIILAPENNGYAKLSDNQLNWLKETIKKNASIDKPIFIFLHQPFKDTVFGSDAWAGIENHEELYDILKMYPQVMFFTGHSHYNLEHNKTMCKKDFTMFNTGSVNYIMTKGDRYEPASLSQGLVVEVFEHKVVVRCREFSTHKWIGKYEVEFPNVSK